MLKQSTFFVHDDCNYAEIIKAILSGNGEPAHNAAVIINCAALLYLHNKAPDLVTATKQATQVLASGQALNTLTAMVEISNLQAPVGENK